MLVERCVMVAFSFFFLKKKVADKELNSAIGIGINLPSLSVTICNTRICLPDIFRAINPLQ